MARILIFIDILLQQLIHNAFKTEVWEHTKSANHKGRTTGDSDSSLVFMCLWANKIPCYLGPWALN